MRHFVKSIAMFSAMLVCISQTNIATFASELTAEELCEKYAFTYDIEQNDSDSYVLKWKNDASTVPMSNAQREEYLEKLKAAGYDMNLIATLASESTEPYDGVIDGYKYKELENGTIKIVGMQRSYIEEHQPEELVIPETINNKPVTVIGASAFEYYGDDLAGWVRTENSDIKKLQRIVIPDTVEIICDKAFDHCRVNAINLPKNIKYIGYRAFCCTGLRELAKSTSGKEDLIILPDSIEYIAFDGLGELGSGSMSSDGKTMILHAKIQFPDSPVLIMENYHYSSDKISYVFYDENGNEIMNDSLLVGNQDYILTGQDALRYYMEKNVPETNYTENTVAVYVYQGDLHDRQALDAFLTQHGDNELTQIRLFSRAYELVSSFMDVEKFYSASIEKKSSMITESHAKAFHYIMGDFKVTAQELPHFNATVGDVNNDGQLTIADSVLLARLVAEDETASVSAQGLANADVNGDGELTSDDTTALLKLLSNN